MTRRRRSCSRAGWSCGGTCAFSTATVTTTSWTTPTCLPRSTSLTSCTGQCGIDLVKWYSLFFFFLYSTDTFQCILVQAHRGARNVYINYMFKSGLKVLCIVQVKKTLKAHGNLLEGERQYFPLKAVDGCTAYY